MTRTRFKEIGITKSGNNLWRYVDLSDDPTGKKLIVIGPHYRTKMEALGDLERYATEYGCNYQSCLCDTPDHQNHFGGCGQ